MLMCRLQLLPLILLHTELMCTHCEINVQTHMHVIHYTSVKLTGSPAGPGNPGEPSLPDVP